MQNNIFAKVLRMLLFYVGAFLLFFISTIFTCFDFEVSPVNIFLLTLPVIYTIALLLVNNKKLKNKLIVVFTIMNIPLSAFLHGIISYCIGVPVLYKFVYFTQIEQRNPDRYYRFEYRDSDDGTTKEGMPTLSMAINNWTVKRMFDIFGYSSNSYRGYYPSKEEVIEIYNNKKDKLNKFNNDSLAQFKEFQRDILANYDSISIKYYSYYFTQEMLALYILKYDKLYKVDLFNYSDGKYNLYAEYKYKSLGELSSFVTDSITHKPIKNLKVYFYKDSSLIDSAVTNNTDDSEANLNVLLPHGNYKIYILSENYKQPKDNNIMVDLTHRYVFHMLEPNKVQFIIYN